MLGLLLFFLLIAVGTLLAFRLSSALKVKMRMLETLFPFEELDAELRRLRRSLQNDLELSSSEYIQGFNMARLKAIPLDELKKHATGVRLQALKDVGIRSVADLQGWNMHRVSQVRGVGPKSAGAIVQAVARIIAATKALPIDHPTPLFSGDAKHQLMQALYRQHWFDMHIAEHGDVFTKDLTRHQKTRDEVVTKISFSRWLWKFGSNETIRHNVNRANAMIETLEGVNSRSMRDKLSMSLSGCRAVCANRVPAELIIEDFNENGEFYDSRLTNRLGKSGDTAPAKSMPQPAGSNIAGTSDLSPVAFVSMVPRFPPQENGLDRTTTVSPETQLQHSEGLISVNIGLNVGQRPTEFALPAAQGPARSKDLRWLTRGEAIQIQGHTLLHGFVYVGKGVNSERHYALNPWLSAKAESSTPPEVAGYCSSYSDLNSAQRCRYLDWLAEGASSPTESTFGMLYFYGLERRVLDVIQGNLPNPPPARELKQLLEEVHRFGDLFKDRPGSVTQCCLHLCDFAAARTFDEDSVPELLKACARTYELPFIMRYSLGCFMRDGIPIPAELALRWAYVEPTIYLRTPATRCPQEFEMAFARVYEEKFGDGLIVPPNKTNLQLVYQPGWPMHPEPEIKCHFPGIPDVAALCGPQQTLKALVEQSTAMIDGYSRYLGRNAVKIGTLEAFLNLPLRFWPLAQRDRWQVFLTSIVDPIAPVSFEWLLQELGYVGDPALAKITEIVANLNRVLVGFEPDIIAGGRRPKPLEIVTLFRLTSEYASDRSTNEYKGASLTVSLSACITLADGHASEEEALAVEAMIESWQHLHVDLRARLRAQYRLQVRQGISLSSFKSRFSSLTVDSRIQLALALSSLATVDGNLAATEVKLLEQVYQALDLEPQLLYSHLHRRSQCEHPIQPPALSLSSGTHNYPVDATRLAALRRET
jgi:uncharacterized tellurite resistance protein B-like protein